MGGVLGHWRLLGFGRLHLLRLAALGALVAEEIIRRRLPGFDDEDALRRQEGEDCQRVHVYRDPDGKKKEDKKKRRGVRTSGGCILYEEKEV